MNIEHAIDRETIESGKRRLRTLLSLHQDKGSGQLMLILVRINHHSWEAPAPNLPLFASD